MPLDRFDNTLLPALNALNELPADKALQAIQAFLASAAPEKPEDAASLVNTWRVIHVPGSVHDCADSDEAREVGVELEDLTDTLIRWSEQTYALSEAFFDHATELDREPQNYCEDW